MKRPIRESFGSSVSYHEGQLNAYIDYLEKELKKWGDSLALEYGWDTLEEYKAFLNAEEE